MTQFSGYHCLGGTYHTQGVEKHFGESCACVFSL